ncbi:hypothetical protein GGR54DRAFT_638364 [Hypoxylon sp. NC1633]|nr:hypothetical protein GGR54DRAFT_638364 [Hypoxylon sp. NC1633]
MPIVELDTIIPWLPACSLPPTRFPKTITGDNSTFIDSSPLSPPYFPGRQDLPTESDTGRDSGSDLRPDLKFVLDLRDKLDRVKRIGHDLQRQIDDFLDHREDIRADYLKSNANSDDIGSNPGKSPVELDESDSLKTEALASILKVNDSISSDGLSVSTYHSGLTSQASSSLLDTPWLVNPPGDFSLDPSHPFFTVESIAIEEVIKSYQASEQNACASGADGAARTTAPSRPSQSQCPSGTASQSQSQKGSSSQKRQRDDDDGCKKPQVKYRRKQIENGKKRLACPFQKRYPLKHLLCGTRGDSAGFDTIAHIKNHLKRSHIRLPNYCPRCKIEFSSAQARDEHIMQGMDSQPCDLRPFRDETALPWDHDMSKALHERVNKTLDLHEQWFSILDIIFSDIPRPSSCLVDDDLCEHVLEFHSFVVTSGSEVVRSVLSDNGLLPELGQGNDLQRTAELETFAERVFELASTRIFENWISQRRQAGSQDHLPSATPSLQNGSISSGDSFNSGGNLPLTGNSLINENVDHNDDAPDPVIIFPDIVPDMEDTGNTIIDEFNEASLGDWLGSGNFSDDWVRSFSNDGFDVAGFFLESAMDKSAK